MDDDRPRVLVVEDEVDLAHLYETYLETEYDVTVATDGETALDVVSDDHDVALLDRRMPETTGDEVLAGIRERELDCRVAMITAVEPDVDVVEMAFDDYLVKPVSREELHSLVEVLLRRATYDQQTQEFFQLASKKVALESSTDHSVRESEEYESLTAEMREIQDSLNETLTDLSTEDFEEAFRELPGGEVEESSTS
jgi:DNA-binding response OmpR family regulator